MLNYSDTRTEVMNRIPFTLWFFTLLGNFKQKLKSIRSFQLFCNVHKVHKTIGLNINWQDFTHALSITLYCTNSTLDFFSIVYGKIV